MTTTALEVSIPPGEPFMDMRRFLAAPPRLVFEAFTDPAQLPHWWGPRVLSLVVCEVDLRVGGSYRFVQRAPDGREFGFHGDYREVAPYHRLVTTFVYEGAPEHQAVETMTFEEVDGGTMLWNHVVHDTVWARDMHVANGMEEGMTDSYLRLDEWLAERSGS